MTAWSDALAVAADATAEGRLDVAREVLRQAWPNRDMATSRRVAYCVGVDEEDLPLWCVRLEKQVDVVASPHWLIQEMRDEVNNIRLRANEGALVDEEGRVAQRAMFGMRWHEVLEDERWPDPRPDYRTCVLRFADGRVEQATVDVGLAHWPVPVLIDPDDQSGQIACRETVLHRVEFTDGHGDYWYEYVEPGATAPTDDVLRRRREMRVAASLAVDAGVDATREED